ncbi:glycosyltransferase [Bizionia saleffrena]|uniref:Glycosyltransferase n=1 Tax=Bizionia saleffrena TaxID=291189 RepID=A0A8H2LC90_9FLAO|nr:glycosyltransferase [Bizionia saleffrena]TYB73919.1 glycosyltransferase [Bizionia saleffrena]
MIVLDIVFYSFVVIVCIQVVFYGIVFGSFAFYKPRQTTPSTLPVSVLICAKNEAKNLASFLPSILNQNYPNFQIVLINDASSDNTLELMESFAEHHSNIKIVNVKNTEAFWGKKKYALTLGIKSATHEHLLLTDADCQPVSKNWISEMTAHFSEKNTIILGYGAYDKVKNSVLNKVIRYETLLTAIQYFSFAKIGIPFMGVGRNLAYKRSEFFKTNGFINHIDIRSGDDDLFINEAATSENTTLCFTQDSFTSSIPKTSLNNWYRQKRRHVSTAKKYKPLHKYLLGLFYSSQLLFWLFSIVLLAIGFYWQFVVALILLRFVIQFFAIGFSAKKLNEFDLLIILPFLELSLIVFQFTIFIANLISKPNYWK